VRGICEQPVVSQLRGAGSTYGDFVRLAPTEHSLLLRFLKNLVKLVGDADLLGRFWGQEFHETTDYLKVDVMHLRRTVGDDSGNLIAIGTECGSCFVLVPDQVPRIGEGLVVGLA
jgi:DNA-binding response OmpR family regulator